ncbi:MAG: diacylglycerol kinase family lipid kinase [Caulobacterales bacterium]|nr:diacylglycerol kinase family lipid kinase [Caulobacterales bacterium]
MKTRARKVVLKRVAVVVNPASGGAGPGAAAEAERILVEQGVKGIVTVPGDAGVYACLEAALKTRPDLLVIVAGDGTARAGAEMAGPHGPLVAPLPGGTMNMLPGALYGARDWQTAMAEILADGVIRPVSGGMIEGHAFYVAAILGSPALWAEAREAAREGDLRRAWARTQRALRRAFSGRLRFSLDGAPRAKAEALALMCPLVSRAVDDDEGCLEAAAIDPAGALEIFRLGFRAALGDWRADETVEVTHVRKGRAWASGRIPAVLDGEPTQLGPVVDFRFRPVAFRALVPREPEDVA